MSAVKDSKCIGKNFKNGCTKHCVLISVIVGDVASSKQKARRKKEKDLTVTPLRIQLEKCQTSLKETLRLGLQASDVSPLETQIAGHGSGDSGMLEHQSGLVLKPVQAPPRGLREVTFYQGLYSSLREDDLRMRNFAPKYFGTENVKMSNGEFSEFIVLGKAIILEELTLKICI